MTPPNVLTALDYRALLGAAPSGMLLVGEDGVIIESNPMAEKMFGWPPGSLVGLGVEDLVPTDRRGAHVEHRARYARSPHVRPMGAGLELKGQRRDGSTFPVEVSLSPWSSDELNLVICCIRDTSELSLLRTFTDRALRATEDERLRISRELHDDTAQRLATLILEVGALAREEDAALRAAAFESIREEITSATDSVRRLARGLRPPELAELGLAEALRAFGRLATDPGVFTVHVDAETVGGWAETDALVVYRIIQEAVSNARRHSGANEVHVALTQGDRGVVATVTDDGVGFEPRRSDGGLTGLGLVGMNERAVLVGAHLDIESQPGQGTVVTVTVPLRPDAE